METTFKPGDVVMTPHGEGVILCSELANDAWPGQAPRMIATGRYVIKLNDGHTWAIKSSNPCYWPNELKHI
jgi:hypothetical protein